MSYSDPPLAQLAHYLHSRRESLVGAWSKSVVQDDNVLTAVHLSRNEFKDHIPQVLRAFEVKLRLLNPEDAVETSSVKTNAVETNASAHLNSNAGEIPNAEKLTDAAQKHGAHRWQQGYSIEEMAREWGHLNLVVLEEIEKFASQQSQRDAADWTVARRAWAQTVCDGISSGASRFDQLTRSEAKSRMHDLEATLEKFRVLERERGEIMRQASHDIRGTLTVVQGTVSLLDWEQLQKLDATQREHVIQMLNNGVVALSDMMGDMLDLSRLEAGQETRQLENFDVGELLSQLGHNAKLLATEKDLSLKLDGPTPFQVEGDGSMIRRIVQNLLLNAVKYTPYGGVSLVWRPLKGSEDLRWEMVVADTGPGFEEGRSKSIPSDGATPESNTHDGVAPNGIAGELHNLTLDARAVGTPLQPLDGAAPQPVSPDSPPTSSRRAPTRAKGAPGEGVGLSIVKRLCEILDATLELETGQQGSTFRVIFPRVY